MGLCREQIHGKVPNSLFAVCMHTAKKVTAEASQACPRCLPRWVFAVCMHTAKKPFGTLPCICSRQRPTVIPFFSVFAMIPAIQTHIAHISITANLSGITATNSHAYHTNTSYKWSISTNRSQTRSDTTNSSQTKSYGNNKCIHKLHEHKWCITSAYSNNTSSTYQHITGDRQVHPLCTSYKFESKHMRFTSHLTYGKNNDMRFTILTNQWT